MWLKCIGVENVHDSYLMYEEMQIMLELAMTILISDGRQLVIVLCNLRVLMKENQTIPVLATFVN